MLMRVLIYSQPSFFDTELPFVRELSRFAEVHLMLEVSPEGWQSGFFDVANSNLPSGLFYADPILAGQLPASMRDSWQHLASFKLLVRTAHPLRVASPDYLRGNLQ